jgi:DUF4097 and DUF4098 domain-containing protein YvlB
MLLLLTTLVLQTDTTFTVRPGSRLELSNPEGEITITAWDRKEVRIRADHDEDTRIDVEISGNQVSVRPQSRSGPAEAALRLQVPADMALQISSREGDVSVEGTRADVSVESVEGAIRLRGGKGAIALSSVDGDIALEGTEGRMDVHTVDGTITGRRLSGDLKVDTVDGAIELREIDSPNAELTSVDGAVLFEGPVKGGGRYRLSSHDGGVTLVTPTLDATVTVSTFDGSFQSDFPVTLTRTQSSKRMTFTQGKGSARVELESFDGNVEIRKQ